MRSAAASRHLAVGGDRALRFAPDIGPLAAARDDSTESLQALADLVRRTETSFCFKWARARRRRHHRADDRDGRSDGGAIARAARSRPAASSG